MYSCGAMYSTLPHAISGCSCASSRWPSGPSMHWNSIGVSFAQPHTLHRKRLRARGRPPCHARSGSGLGSGAESAGADDHNSRPGRQRRDCREHVSVQPRCVLFLIHAERAPPPRTCGDGQGGPTSLKGALLQHWPSVFIIKQHLSAAVPGLTRSLPRPARHNTEAVSNPVSASWQSPGTMAAAAAGRRTGRRPARA